MASPRERDHRGEGRLPALPPVARPPQVPARRHHFHDVPPWPHQYHHDYILVEGWGWWPRWFPYWDQNWQAYWWYLYDYYGGDAYPVYAEYARDAVLRSNAPQWGLVVGGSYGGTQVGIQSYGIPAVTSRSSAQGWGYPNQLAAYRRLASESAQRTHAATGRVLFGFRDSPWGSELTMFGALAGLRRWINEQAADPDVWYAAAFDLGQSSSPSYEKAA